MSSAEKRTFVRVSVPLTKTEYRKLLAKRALLPWPTVAGVVREALGLPGRPYGYVGSQITEAEYFRRSQEEHADERR